MKSFELNGMINSDSTVSDMINMSPTVSPKSMPMAGFTCVDSPLGVIVPTGEIDCLFLANNPSYCSFPGAGSHCPLTCNKCPEFQCADSELEFIYGNDSYKCSVLKLVSEMDRESY